MIAPSSSLPAIGGRRWLRDLAPMENRERREGMRPIARCHSAQSTVSGWVPGGLDARIGRISVSGHWGGLAPTLSQTAALFGAGMELFQDG